MRIDKNFKGLEFKDGRYVYNGNIETIENLIIELDAGLYVTGYIQAGGCIKAGNYIQAGNYIKAGDSIEAGSYIKAGYSIKAGGSIEAGNYIQAGDGILAGLYITAKTTISCGLNIYAGICTWRQASEEDKTITCSKLIKGKAEYGILKELGEPKRKITIDNKEIEISEESYLELKKSLEV